MTAAADLTAGSDSSLWTGGHVGGCLQVRAWCMGARARLARDLGETGPASGSDGSTRILGELLLVAARPISGRHWSLTPAVGAGADWMRANVPAVEIDQPASTRVLGIRMESMLTAAFSLSLHWALTAEAGASVGRAVSTAMSSGPGASATAAEILGGQKPPMAQFRTAIGFDYRR